MPDKAASETKVFGATNTQATSLRLEYMKVALDIFEHNPTYGVGYGVYRQAERKYRNSVISETNDPHNLYLRIFAEVGAFGGLTFFLLISSLVFYLLTYLFKNKYASAI